MKMKLYDRIDKMVDGVKLAVGEEFAAYLYGSVMFDDYREDQSDVNVVFLTKYPLSDQQAENALHLRERLAEKSGDKRFAEFCGAVLSEEAFLKGDPTTAVVYAKSGATISHEGFAVSLCERYSMFAANKKLFGKDVFAEQPYPEQPEIVKEIKHRWSDVDVRSLGARKAFFAIYQAALDLYLLSCGEPCGKTDALLWAIENGVADERSLMQAVALRLTKEASKTEDAKSWARSDAPQQLLQTLVDKMLSAGVAERKRDDYDASQAATKRPPLKMRKRQL